MQRGVQGAAVQGWALPWNCRFPLCVQRPGHQRGCGLEWGMMGSQLCLLGLLAGGRSLHSGLSCTKKETGQGKVPGSGVLSWPGHHQGSFLEWGCEGGPQLLWSPGLLGLHFLSVNKHLRQGSLPPHAGPALPTRAPGHHPKPLLLHPPA